MNRFFRRIHRFGKSFSARRSQGEMAVKPPPVAEPADEVLAPRQVDRRQVESVAGPLTKFWDLHALVFEDACLAGKNGAPRTSIGSTTRTIACATWSKSERGRTKGSRSCASVQTTAASLPSDLS